MNTTTIDLKVDHATPYLEQPDVVEFAPATGYGESTESTQPDPEASLTSTVTEPPSPFSGHFTPRRSCPRPANATARRPLARQAVSAGLSDPHGGNDRSPGRGPGCTAERETRKTMIIEEPWTTVRNWIRPVEDVAELRAMEKKEFALMVRANLNPFDESAQVRKVWTRFWDVLASYDDLRTRTLDVLEDFLVTTADAQSSGTLTQTGSRRAKEFGRACTSAGQRLLKTPPKGPLGWAGQAGAFHGRSAVVINELVQAIARHRAATRAGGEVSPADEALWAKLRKVNLDPADYGSGR